MDSIQMPDFATIFKKIGSVLIILVSLTLGYLFGEYHTKSKIQVEKPKGGIYHKKENTSIAINENNELVIMKKTTENGENKYKIVSVYADSIGKTIFRLYASQIAAEVK